MSARPFEDLGFRGQVGRLRALGQTVLPRFGLPASAPLVLLHHGENSVFRTADRRGRPHVLRIHRTGYQSPAMIRAEMAWLEALHRDTALRLPEPVKARDGQYVQQQRHAGVPGERSCVLFDWVPGRFCHGRRGPTYYRRLGELAGAIHAHGQSWKRPAGFQRRPWNRAVLQGDADGFGNPFETPGVTKRDHPLFTEALTRAAETMRGLGRGKATWGLIHADLHAGNVLAHQGTLGGIDFDDCGPGWFAYEMAVAIGPPFDMESYWQRFAWFRETYEQHLPIDVRTVAAQECFVVTRRLSMVGWIGTRSDNPRLAALAPRYIQLARESAQAWMRRD